MDASLIRLETVTKAYPRGGVVALQEVTWSLGRGDYAAVTGPSGSGKSTLLYLACGIDVPSSGRVFFGRHEPRGLDPWARLRARHVGLVFQCFHLLPALTALENVEIPMFGVVGRPADRRRRARDLLARVGLSDRADHLPAELSGGEQQRLAVARSLANAPDVILADEPTGNLDTASAASVMDLLEDLHARDGITLVIVTHDPSLAARARRRVALLDGRIVAEEEMRGKAA